MGNRSNRRKPTRRERQQAIVASKTVNYGDDCYTLDVYPSDTFSNSFQTVVSTATAGVVYRGDNYPTIGTAINETKHEFLGIDY
jgi:hypothetical protein